jgi:SET domain-containing protein
MEFLIKDSQGRGKGFFTVDSIGANEILFKFEGKNIHADEASKLPNNDRLLQIGPQLYVDCGTHFGAFTNHDCNPNCYIKIAVNTAFLLSLRPINAGDELFFDYSLTSTETLDTWTMKCNCHPFSCRKLISGFYTIPETQRKKLIAAGMVPGYVLNGI